MSNPCFFPGCQDDAVYMIDHIQTGGSKLGCRRHARHAFDALDRVAPVPECIEREEAAFWFHVTRAESGCWTWTGPRISGADKIGGMHWRGERLSARRIAWALEHGHVPERALLTSCRNAACLNPAHAYEVMDPELAESIVRDRRPGETITALARRHGRPRESLSRYLSASTSAAATITAMAAETVRPRTLAHSTSKA